MFFQINVTPKEKKVARRCDKEQDEPEQENFELVLAPFQPQAKIRLDSAVNKPASCALKIKNPSNRILNVTVTKTPPPERAVELGAMELVINAESAAEMNIVWTPRESGSWRDTLQFLDSRRIKYDVALVTTAKEIKKPRGQGRSRVLAPSNANRVNGGVGPKQSVPPSTSPPRKNPNATSLNLLNVPSKRPRLNIQHEDKENEGGADRPSERVHRTYRIVDDPNRNSKISVSSPAAHDFSAIMNSTKFNLTPVKPNAGLDLEQIDFSLRTDGIPSPDLSHMPNLRRETYVAAKYCKSVVISDAADGEEGENFVDSLSPQPEDQGVKQSSDFSLLINDMNLLTPKAALPSLPTQGFSPRICSTVNRARVISENSPTRESSPGLASGGNNSTFDISCTSVGSNARANGTYELITSPSRISTLEPIKPTRLSASFGTMSPVRLSISSAPTGKPVSSSPLCPETASTHHDRSSRTSFAHISQSQNDDASVKQVLEADLWAQTRTDSSAIVSSMKPRRASLERIDEEKSPTDSHKTSSFERREGIVARESWNSGKIEISPPRKFPSSSRNAPMRRVSPTKGAKIRKDKFNAEPVAGLKKKVEMNCTVKRGQISIPGVRMASLSLASLSRAGKAEKAEKAEKSSKTSVKEVSVKLHDPNDFLINFCNPDPFGATTTQDPFLTSTLYYDDKWMHHQEIKFKNWLNALLTSPEHLVADVDTIRVDVGKVWQSCRAREDVALAETREAVSARYHTNTRLNALRKAACAMFRREQVAKALTRATVCIERGNLKIREDRDLHRDIGLQKGILELFLSYNPLWLRIGLEAVYGETIPLNSNNDLVGLTRFLITRFFTDPFIVRQHSHSANSTVRLPSFAVHMNKFILKKFVLLVFFLDYAKRNKLIGHDPCLFHKKAPHKDSRSILLTFSRELLSGVGDVTRVLRSHGYEVTYQQSHLDEYDYAVKDLSTDLRDGVRLCRVMELITGDRSLTCRCRAPAISRLQKVHNADIALTALSRCGYNLTGDIDAKSVADGHREKTLSLLWQIIYKYQAPRFEKAAKIVQKWWRAKLWYVRVRHYLRTRRRVAASKIQRAWRCRRARKIVEQLRLERARIFAEKDAAARAIQLGWIRRMRMLRERNKFLVARMAILAIQRWFRRKRETAPFVENFRLKRRAVVTIQRHWRAEILMRNERVEYLALLRASVKIQSWWRARLAGRRVFVKYQEVRNASILVQSRWRANRLMMVAREDFTLQLDAIRKIQFWWRMILKLKRDRNAYLLKKHAVQTIEGWSIAQRVGMIERRKFKEIRSSAITVQRWYRRYLETRHHVEEFKRVGNSSRIIQHWWRSVRIERRYKLERRSCIKIQNWWRGVVATRWNVASFAKLRQAALTVQKNWRMKKTRGDYLRMKKAVAKIESWRCNLLVSRAARREFFKKKQSSLRIQIWWRGWKITWVQRDNYLNYRRNVIAMQNRWRSNNLARRTRLDYTATREAATKIQATWRMTRERRNYTRLVKRDRAARILQDRWRSTVVSRKTREQFVEYRAAIVVVQTRYRAIRAARATRSEYLKKREAAIVIQKNWRMLRASRRYVEQKNAAVVLQNRWRSRQRGIRCRASYVSLRKATIDLQRRYRANKIALTTRKSYLGLVSAVLNIQRRWRANKLMKEAKKRFADYRNAAVMVQSRWRMMVRRRFYRTARKSALTIQSAWAAYRASRRCRNAYLQLRNAAIIIQRRYRANKLGRLAREQYARTRRILIRVQAIWRNKLENRRREEAAISLQTWWRSILEMRRCRFCYETRRRAALVVQKHYRARKIGLETRRDYDRIVRAIVKIQRAWRGFCRRKRDEEWRRDCRNAVSRIENWWIRAIEMRRIREAELAIMRERAAAATKIQTAWRGHRIRRDQSSRMKELRIRSLQLAEDAVPTATIAHQMQEATASFLVANNIGQLSMCLTTLDTLTRLTPAGCIDFCKLNLVEKVYGTLAMSNRSLPWMQVCLQCSSILITLAKLSQTKQYVYRVEHIENLARLMNITVEKHVDLFLSLATLMWLLAEHPPYAEAITGDPRTRWLLGSLHAAVNKKKMNARPPTPGILNRSRVRDPLPNSKPDWGLKQKRPRLFTTVHHAISSLIKRLRMDPAT